MEHTPDQSNGRQNENKSRLEIELTVIAETGLSIGGSGNTGLRADKTMLRDGRNYPIIPASQIKGRLRHACEALLRSVSVPVCHGPYPDKTCPQIVTIPKPPCPICLLFGSPWYRGTLNFFDLHLQPSPGQDSAVRPGIGIDRKRRIARDQLLFLTETTAPGAQPLFQAKPAISGMISDIGVGVLLLAGFQTIHSLGSGKSRGMGWTTIRAKAYAAGHEIMLDEAKSKEALTAWLQNFTI